MLMLMCVISFWKAYNCIIFLKMSVLTLTLKKHNKQWPHAFNLRSSGVNFSYFSIKHKINVRECCSMKPTVWPNQLSKLHYHLNHTKIISFEMWNIVKFQCYYDAVMFGEYIERSADISLIACEYKYWWWL